MTTDELSTVFAALADPTRRGILSQLAGGTASVTELAAPYEISLPAITRHLKVLEQAGLIIRHRHQQWRPCELNAAPLREASDWIEAYRQFWSESLDRLDEYLTTVQKSTEPKPKKSKTEQPNVGMRKKRRSKQ